MIKGLPTSLKVIISSCLTLLQPSEYNKAP